MLPTDLENIITQFAATITIEQFEDEIREMWYFGKQSFMAVWLLDEFQNSVYLEDYSGFSREIVDDDLKIWCEDCDVETYNFERAVLRQGMYIAENLSRVHALMNVWQQEEDEAEQEEDEAEPP